MKKYNLYILTEKEVVQLLDNKIESLEFNNNGFICNKFDVVGVLQKRFDVPIVSIFKIDRPHWDDIYITTANGVIDKDGKCCLDYSTEDEYKEVLRDIFMESDVDEYEVYENYELLCDDDMKKRIDAWVHDEY